MYDMKNLSKMKNLEAHAPEAMKRLSPSTKRLGLRERFRESIRN